MAERPTPTSSYRHQNKHCHTLKSEFHQCVCLMECEWVSVCVFSMLLSPQLHSECPWMEEGLHREGTPFLPKYGRQHGLLKGQECVSVYLCMLKRKILNNSAACEQKVHIITVFIGFAVKSSSRTCFTTETLPHLSLPVSLSVYLPLPISLSVSSSPSASPLPCLP